jgi:Fe-S oxidoreductase
MSIPNHYHRETQRYLENCTRCGLCARGCPVLPHTDVAAISPKDIQTSVFEGMTSGVFDPQARTKAFACMECFKCTVDMCPEELNPMLVNEIIKGKGIAEGSTPGCIGDVRAPDSAHRVLACLQVSLSDHTRITTASDNGAARYVFFPGCNVYFQPQKILAALDVMDAVGDDYAFIPGLDHCCGDSFFFEGRIEDGAACAEALVAAIAAYRPEAVVLWCPTCQCRFAQTLSPALKIPFEVLSFPQYLAANMPKLPLGASAAGTVTLHEACKSAYTGIDRNGARHVLRQLPGVVLREMERHGPDAVCCGSGAACWYPQSSDRMRTERLEEAARTGAERLVTVCHYCSQTFAVEERQFDFEIVSYIDLVAAALGRAREDKFKQYTRWGDLKRILKDAEAQITASPFSRERFVEVIRPVFSG